MDAKQPMPAIGQMNLFKQIIPKDTETTLMWHTLLKNKEFEIPVHPDYDAYLFYGFGQLEIELDGNREEQESNVGMQVIQSARGTSLKVKNIGNNNVDFFLIKVF